MEMKVVRRCLLCGAPLQSEDPGKIGYIDPGVYTKRTAEDVVYCNACYAKRHFNPAPASVAAASEGFLTMLKDARASDSLIVYVIDLFSFECSFVPEVTRLIRGLPILVIANKRDLLPKEADDRALRAYVASVFEKEGLSVKAEDVVLTSLSTFSDIGDAMGLLELKRRRHDAYLVGAKMSGKSLFVSSFLRLFHNPSKEAISVSDYPGTDVRVMAIPLDSSSCLYDTPGTDLSNSYVSLVEPSVLHDIVPERAVRERKLEVKEGEVALAGGLAHLEVTEGFVKLLGYFASEVSLKKASLPKKGTTDVARIMSRAGASPRTGFLKEATDFDAFEIDVASGDELDLAVAGLGWWHLSAKKDSRLRLYLMKGVGVYLSKERKIVDGRK